MKGRSEHGGVLSRVAGQDDTWFVAVHAVRHDPSTPARDAAYLMVSGWDRQLVPDARGEVQRPDPGCPVEALAAVGGRWTTLVLRDLIPGPRSFGQLRDGLPTLSDKVLAQRLTQLLERGLIIRKLRRGFPSRSVYSLTAAGERLRPLLAELYRTGSALQSAQDPRVTC